MERDKGELVEARLMAEDGAEGALNGCLLDLPQKGGEKPRSRTDKKWTSR